MKNFFLIFFCITIFCVPIRAQDATQSPIVSPSPSPSPNISIAPTVTSPSASPDASAVTAPFDTPSLIPKDNTAASPSPSSSPVETPANGAPPPPQANQTPSDQAGELPSPSDNMDNGAPAAAQGPQKKTDEAAPDNAFTEPNSFVPETPQAPTDTGTAIAAPKAKENTLERLRVERLKYRKAKTQALKSPDVQTMLDKADEAKTEEDKRAALRKYYELLNKKILKIDPSLSDYIPKVQDAQYRRLDQDRLEPTIPLNPPPTPPPAP